MLAVSAMSAFRSVVLPVGVSRYTAERPGLSRRELR